MRFKKTTYGVEMYDENDVLLKLLPARAIIEKTNFAGELSIRFEGEKPMLTDQFANFKDDAGVALGLTLADTMQRLQTDYFSETVANVSILRYSGVSESFTFSVPAKTYIREAFFKKDTGTPLVTIGTTLAGDEIMEELDVSAYADFQPAKIEKYVAAASTIYVTVSGGTVSMRIELTKDIV